MADKYDDFLDRDENSPVAPPPAEQSSSAGESEWMKAKRKKAEEQFNQSVAKQETRIGEAHIPTNLLIPAGLATAAAIAAYAAHRGSGGSPPPNSWSRIDPTMDTPRPGDSLPPMQVDPPALPPVTPVDPVAPVNPVQQAQEKAQAISRVMGATGAPEVSVTPQAVPQVEPVQVAPEVLPAEPVNPVASTLQHTDPATAPINEKGELKVPEALQSSSPKTEPVITPAAGKAIQFPEGTRPQVIKAATDWATAHPEHAKKLADEGKAFLPGGGAGDNYVYSAQGKQGRLNVINTLNQGNPIGEFANVDNMQTSGKSIKSINAGIAPPQENGVTSRFGKLGVPAVLTDNDKRLQAGVKANGELNMGTVNSHNAQGAALGLIMSIPAFANAATNKDRANVAGETAMGVMPPQVQAMMYSGNAGDPYNDQKMAALNYPYEVGGGRGYTNMPQGGPVDPKAEWEKMRKAGLVSTRWK